MHENFKVLLITYYMLYEYTYQNPVVQNVDSAIYWMVIFSEALMRVFLEAFIHTAKPHIEAI